MTGFAIATIRRTSSTLGTGERQIASVSFTVAADAYDRFMGRYSVPLAPQLAEFARRSPPGNECSMSAAARAR